MRRAFPIRMCLVLAAIAAVAGCGLLKSATFAESGWQKVAISPASPDTFDTVVPARARQYAARGALLLDVRSAGEWSDELGHLVGARRIDIGSVEKRFQELRKWKDRDIVVYCRDGIRSRMGASILARHGYTHVHDLEGGLEAYRDWEHGPPPAK